MEKHVLVIDREKFIRSMFDNAMKESPLKLMTVEGIQDHYYLVDDLSPVAIFFDILTCMGEFERIMACAEKTKLYAMGFPEDFDLVKTFEHKLAGKIEKPIPASQFRTTIERYCL